MKQVVTTEALVIGGDEFFESARCTLTQEDDFNIQQGRGLLEYNENIHSINYRLGGSVDFFDEDDNQIESERGRIFDICFLVVERDGVSVILNEKHNVDFEVHLHLNL